MFRDYGVAIAVGALFALGLFAYVALSVRAYVERRATWSPMRMTIVTMAVTLVATAVNALAHRHDPGAFIKHAAVALGTACAVSIPLSLVYARWGPRMTEREAEEWFARQEEVVQQRHLDLFAKIFVASHGLKLLYGAAVIAALIVTMLVLALLG